MLKADERYDGGKTRTTGQFLAKWMETLATHMNEGDRVEFVRDLSDAIPGAEAISTLPAPRSLLLAAIMRFAQHRDDCDAVEVQWRKGPCNCGWQEMKERLRLGTVPEVKLIRDKIPEIASAKGEKITVRRAENGELKRLLAEKLVEEAAEFADNPSLEELADVLETFVATTLAHGWLTQQVSVEAERKRLERGGFAGGTVMVMEDKRSA